MSKKQSAGILPYRTHHRVLEVFLVHPGGPFWVKKEFACWSIAKGEFGSDEQPLGAARREFFEETGKTLDGTFQELTPVKQAGGKTVYAWAVEADTDETTIQSHTFEMEWPPRSGKMENFPEVDRAQWFPIPEARQRILKSQIPFLDQLLQLFPSEQSTTFYKTSSQQNQKTSNSKSHQSSLFD